MLRRSHNEQVAKIFERDPEASDNDKYVALTFLRSVMAVKGVLPFCQDTGTAIIHGEKGQQVWTGYCDEEALSGCLQDLYGRKPPLFPECSAHHVRGSEHEV